MKRDETADPAPEEAAGDVRRTVHLELTENLYQALAEQAHRRRQSLSEMLRAAAARHLAYLAVLEDPASTPCDHGQPRGCGECALCRRGASDPDGEVCRQCLRGYPVIRRDSGPRWHHTPMGLRPELWDALRTRAVQEERPVGAIVGTALGRYLDESTP